MQVSASALIAASPKQVWKTIADIPNAANHISGITNIEVLDQATGPSIQGLKWKETRIMFGKEASEIMWVTQAKANAFYDTRAESHGMIYTMRVSVEEYKGGSMLTMEFGGEPVSRGAKIMGALTNWMMIKSVRKSLIQDLEDVRQAVEQA